MVAWNQSHAQWVSGFHIHTESNALLRCPYKEVFPYNIFGVLYVYIFHFTPNKFSLVRFLLLLLLAAVSWNRVLKKDLLYMYGIWIFWNFLVFSRFKIQDNSEYQRNLFFRLSRNRIWGFSLGEVHSENVKKKNNQTPSWSKKYQTLTNFFVCGQLRNFQQDLSFEIWFPLSKI